MGRGEDAIRRHVQRALRELMMANRPHTEILTVPMPQRRNLLQSEGSHHRNRAMAQSIQHDQATLILELSAASTPNIHSPIASPGSQLRDAIVSIPLVQNIRQVNTSQKEEWLSWPIRSALSVRRNRATHGAMIPRAIPRPVIEERLQGPRR
jgi:hypothetical protein